MSAFAALSNLIQTIHDPPNTFVLLSHVANYSWQLRLFLIDSTLRCYTSPKREEISRDRKLVAGEKEAAFKDWQSLADFISSKIVAGDLHVAGWGTESVQVIIDPGRPSSLTIPLTELDGGGAAAAMTDLIYTVANDARENRRCALLPGAAPSEPQVDASPASPAKSNRSTKEHHQTDAVQKAEQEELAKLKAELAIIASDLARERAKPKALPSSRPVALPPKAVAGASTAMPGQARRVIRRAEFSDEESDDSASPEKGKAKGKASTSRAEAASAAGAKKSQLAASAAGKKQARPPVQQQQVKRVIRRAEFDDEEDENEDENDDRAVLSPSKVRGAAKSAGSSSTAATGQGKSMAKPPQGAAKRVIKRAEFSDDEEEEVEAPAGKKRKP